MAEQMGDRRENLPTDDFAKVYGKWAKGNWGLIMTGTCASTPVYVTQAFFQGTDRGPKKFNQAMSKWTGNFWERLGISPHRVKRA
jgi:2,4-dienoyl-CoA reductase-like NADH-dependent reductase (Old Yellow Enzyme family)